MCQKYCCLEILEEAGPLVHSMNQAIYVLPKMMVPVIDFVIPENLNAPIGKDVMLSSCIPPR